ncbi:hypothetical protein VTH82DRAFT_2604 [Thermothelomyces myriococcoides]
MPFPVPFLVLPSLPALAVLAIILLAWPALRLVSRWYRTDLARASAADTARAHSTAVKPSQATDPAVSGSRGLPELTTTSAAAQPIPIPGRDLDTRYSTHAATTITTNNDDDDDDDDDDDTRDSHSATLTLSRSSSYSSLDPARTQVTDPEPDANTAAAAAAATTMTIFPWCSSSSYSLSPPPTPISQPPSSPPPRIPDPVAFRHTWVRFRVRFRLWLRRLAHRPERIVATGGVVVVVVVVSSIIAVIIGGGGGGGGSSGHCRVVGQRESRRQTRELRLPGGVVCRAGWPVLASSASVSAAPPPSFIHLVALVG